MDLLKMMSFCSIYECGSVSKAADKLFCSQPALSKQIASLETELGYPLFERNGKKMVINENGEIFYRFAKTVLNDYSLLKRELYLKNNQTVHEVRFGTTNFIGTYLLPPVLSKFKAVYPSTPVNFTVNFLPSIIELLEKDFINFAIIPANDQIVHDKKYVCDPFLEDEFVLVVPTNHPLNELDNISIYDISEYTFLLSQEQSATRKFIDDILLSYNIQLSSEINMDNINTIKHGILSGLGISILPYKQIEKDASFGLLNYYRFTDIILKRNLYIVYKTKHTFSEEEALFIKHFINK